MENQINFFADSLFALQELLEKGKHKKKMIGI